MDKDRKIPHIIHYCWFGRGEKSPLMLDCMASWKKHFPDYEIIEWNEDNFDFSVNRYCKEAYEQKKWAFVSDYVRLAVVYQYGGIYFDTDVEVLKNFDHILAEGGYLCFENTTNDPEEKDVCTGLGFAAEAGNKIIEAIMHDYDDVSFLVDGVPDITPCPVRNTKVLAKLGLKRDGSMQILDHMRVFPYEYFCGHDIANSHPHITENTYTVHHYAATWKNELSLMKRLKYHYLIPFLQKIMGYEKYDAMKMFLQQKKK